MRFIIATAVAMALTACATPGKFTAKMDGFVGHQEAELIGTYGPPTASYSLNDGSKVISYTRGSMLMLPGATTTQPVTTNTVGNITMNQGARSSTGSYNATSTTFVQNTAAPTAIQLSCTVNFTIDAQGVVRRWVAQGNHCVAQ